MMGDMIITDELKEMLVIGDKRLCFENIEEKSLEPAEDVAKVIEALRALKLANPSGSMDGLISDLIHEAIGGSTGSVVADIVMNAMRIHQFGPLSGLTIEFGVADPKTKEFTPLMRTKLDPHQKDLGSSTLIFDTGGKIVYPIEVK